MVLVLASNHTGLKKKKKELNQHSVRKLFVHFKTFFSFSYLGSKSPINSLL